MARHFQVPLLVPFEGSGFGAGKVWELVRVPYIEHAGGDGGHGLGGALRAGRGRRLNMAGGTEYVTSHAGDTVTIQGRFVDVALLAGASRTAGRWGCRWTGAARPPIDLYRAYPASTSDLGDANGASAPQDRVLVAHGLTRRGAHGGDHLSGDEERGQLAATTCASRAWSWGGGGGRATRWRRTRRSSGCSGA